jgi:Raf kinase inhibitor-like YbhB/YbcL family protein
VDAPLALERPETQAQSDVPLVVRSSVPANGMIPAKYSEYASGISPRLAWDRVRGAKSYALIVEDPDARQTRPFVHWIAWNIPAEMTELSEGMQDAGGVDEPEGLQQGRTSRGSLGYMGPQPPPGDPAHHYHFQLFALDTTLNVPSGADRDTVLRAMRGHVLAKGELVGLYRQLQ